jgi:hypothetical protein
MRASVLLLAIFALTACVEDRYHWNVQHAVVTRWTRLEPGEREQIIRLVSAETRQPIDGITADKPKNGCRRILVYTGFHDTDLIPWTEFQLEKRADGWHIVGRDIISPGMATIMETMPEMTSDKKT